MEFITTGVIAERLGVDRDEVAYALRKGRVTPIGRAGIVRLYGPESIDVVKKIIASKRRRFVDTILDQHPPVVKKAGIS